MDEATLVTGRGDRAGVRLERVLVDPPAVVWSALTDREQLSTWFPCDVEVAGGSWRVGSAITFRFPPDEIDLTLHGEVLEVDEPRSLVYTWGEETLRFVLTPEGAGTRLVLIDELGPSFAARNAAGWETCLDRLTGVAGGGDDGENAWRPRFERYSARFEPVLGAQEGPPSAYRGKV